VISGQVSTKIIKNATSPADYPKVGDFVLFTQFNESSKAIIYRVLHRKTKISRKMVDPTPGQVSSAEQVIATNVDILFIVQAADSNFNIKRLERYVAMALNYDVQPVIILNKIDVNAEWQELLQKVTSRFSELVVIAASATSGQGINEVKNLLNDGRTASFVGSSGVGKSSIINVIIGEDKLKTSAISERLNKGKHTTTHRELFLLPDGGVVIDTPGMRELHLFDGEEGIEQTFKDITQLAKYCKYRDCSHTSEDGCAVMAALEDGEIDEEMYENFIKLRTENKRFKRHIPKQVQKKAMYKKFSKDLRNRLKEKETLF
jgi:ribosome biogenesis GTPase